MQVDGLFNKSNITSIGRAIPIQIGIKDAKELWYVSSASSSCKFAISFVIRFSNPVIEPD